MNTILAFKNALWMIILIALFVGCTRSRLSDQEIQRQKEISESETLKAEFRAVVGEYRGRLINTTAKSEIPATLTLALQDSSTDQGGSPDPVLTPKLFGSLRLIMGSSEFGEYIDAPVRSSEYIAITKTLNLAAEHNQTGAITLNLKLDGKYLNGTWTAPMSGSSGSATLARD